MDFIQVSLFYILFWDSYIKIFSDLIHRNIFRDHSVSCLIYSVYLGYLSITIIDYDCFLT